MQKYQLISAERTKRFGDVSVFRERDTHLLVWIKEVFIENEEVLQKLNNYISSEQEHLHKHFITLEAFINPVESNVCGSCSVHKKLVVVMEFFERDLEGEIERRAQHIVSSSLN